MQLTDYMNRANILFPDCTDKSSLIRIMVSQAHSAGYVSDPDTFLNSIMDRESIVSTGIGLGVAIPHSKMAGIRDFFIILAVTQCPIDWDSLDNKPVQAVFLIGGPDNDQQKYLQILATLTLFIKNSDRRQQLFSSKDTDTLMSLFQG